MNAVIEKNRSRKNRRVSISVIKDRVDQIDIIAELICKKGDKLHDTGLLHFLCEKRSSIEDVGAISSDVFRVNSLKS